MKRYYAVVDTNVLVSSNSSMSSSSVERKLMNKTSCSCKKGRLLRPKSPKGELFLFLMFLGSFNQGKRTIDIGIIAEACPL